MTDSDLFKANLSSLESRGLLSLCTVSALSDAALHESRLKVDAESGWLFEDPKADVRVLLHSRRDPQGEASRQIQSWMDSSTLPVKGLLVVLGSAGLFHVRALAEKLVPGSKIMVFEALPEILATSLSKIPISEIERPGIELRFASHADMPALLEEFRYALRRLDKLEVASFAHPASIRLAPSIYQDFERGFAGKLELESRNRETLARFSRQWILNSLVNLPAMIRSAPAGALSGLFSGSAAIVVGAGPSLDAQLAQLAQAKRDFVLVAAGTALRPLLKAGIKPDFVVAVDSDPKTLLQYEGLDLSGLRLVCSCNVDPALPRLFEGRAFFFSANLSAELNQWLESNGLLPDRLSVGGTVAVSAMDFARLLGCKRVVLCGVDLAMADDGRSHSGGTVYSGRRESDLVPVPGNWQGAVMTTRQFASYIVMVDNYISDLRWRWGVEVMNATNFGARIPNAKLVRPELLGSLAQGDPSNGRTHCEVASREVRLPGAPGAAKVIEDSAIFMEKLRQASSQSLSELRGPTGAAEDAVSELEGLLKSSGAGVVLLCALLGGEIKGIPSSDLLRFHSTAVSVSNDLALVLRHALLEIERSQL